MYRYISIISMGNQNRFALIPIDNISNRFRRNLLPLLLHVLMQLRPVSYPVRLFSRDVAMSKFRTNVLEIVQLI